MKHLLVTALTATLGLTAGQALAQTATATPPPAATDTAVPNAAPAPVITAPEGYVEGDVVLTSDNLEGATVYDAMGDDVGEVHGLVFANGTTSLMKGAAAATAPATLTPDASKATGAAGTTTTAAPAVPAAPAPVAGSVATGDAAAISHAVIDVGGFLGLGEHSVAVPIGDLVIYQKDDDIRIYLPWTREQLEALPEFDENDPATVTR